MSNVLFLISSDKGRGGAEEVLRIIASYFLNKKDEVYVFFLLEKKYGMWEQIKASYSNLHLFYSKRRGKIGIFSVLQNFYSVRKVSFKYVFSSIVECTGLLGILRQLGIIRTEYQVGRESTLVFSRFKGTQLWLNKVMYRLGYPAVDIVVCQTQRMKNELINNVHYITKRSKVVVIPNPIDLNRVHKYEKEYIDDISYYVNYIVSAGRFIEAKGFDILIDAFSMLKKDYPEMHLVILGDGKEKDALNKQVADLDLSDCIHFPGMVSNVYPYFRFAKLCVVSSRIEGFPNVLLQMMSQNEKVVSTTCAGDIDSIKGVFVCQPNDTHSLYETMKRCIESDSTYNRVLFNEELEGRVVDNFIAKLENYCGNNVR